LDWILDRHDVIGVNLVDEIDDGGKCRTLTTAGWSSDQHDAVFYIYYLSQLFRQIEIAEPRRSHRNYTHHDCVRAALLEDIDAKTRITRNTERKVRGAALLETFEWCGLIADDQFGNSRGVGRRQLLQTSDANRNQFSG